MARGLLHQSMTDTTKSAFTKWLCELFKALLRICVWCFETLTLWELDDEI